MKNKIKNVRELLCYAFILLACVVIPLFFEDKYFNITKAKFDAYRFGVIVLLFIFLLQ